MTTIIITGDNNHIAVTQHEQKRSRWGWLLALLRKALGLWTPSV